MFRSLVLYAWSVCMGESLIQTFLRLVCILHLGQDSWLGNGLLKFSLKNFFLISYLVFVVCYTIIKRKNYKRRGVRFDKFVKTTRVLI